MTNKMFDQLIDYFNDDLDDKEKRAFEGHLKECEDCREELEELKALTEDLPFASEPVNPPEGMKERVLANVLQEEQIDVEKQQPKTDRNPPEVAPLPNRDDRQPKKKRSWWTPLLAAALLLSLIGNAYGLFTGNQNEENGGKKESKIANALQSVQLQPKALKNSSGNATMIEGQKGVDVVVQVKNMKALKGDETYQVWLLEDGKPSRAGTFVPDQNGAGAVSYSMKNAGDHDWDQIAITLEPTPDSKTPQGDIVLASEL